VPDGTIHIAEESYRRCQSEPFFRAFYKRFLDSDPVIRDKFVKTDFDRQIKLLQHSIGLLFIYAKRRNPALLERIAARHGRADVDVAPELYPLFTASLLATVKEFDPHFGNEVEQAWRMSIAPGIEFMSGWYSRDASDAGG
jgi:hemoglobin-like flavoprotein